jgi:hypothetical protein
MFISDGFFYNEPSHDKDFDTHSQHVGELPRKKRTGQASDLFNKIINR